jgi:hypothetical protein
LSARRRYSVVLERDVDDEAFNFMLDVVPELVTGDVDVDVDVDVVGDECILSFVGSLLLGENLEATCELLRERGVPCRLASETFSRWT